MIASTALSLALLGQVVLPGSQLDLENAEAKSTLIVVAKIGDGLIAGVGAASFGVMDMEPSETLKGEVEDGGLKKVGIGASGHEEMPKKGEEYVVFLEKYRNPKAQKTCDSVVKMLPKSPENIEAVKSAIKAGRKP